MRPPTPKHGLGETELVSSDRLHMVVHGSATRAVYTRLTRRTSSRRKLAHGSALPPGCHRAPGTPSRRPQSCRRQRAAARERRGTTTFLRPSVRASMMCWVANLPPLHQAFRSVIGTPGTAPVLPGRRAHSQSAGLESGGIWGKEVTRQKQKVGGSLEELCRVGTDTSPQSPSDCRDNVMDMSTEAFLRLYREDGISQGSLCQMLPS